MSWLETALSRPKTLEGVIANAVAYGKQFNSGVLVVRDAWNDRWSVYLNGHVPVGSHRTVRNNDPSTPEPRGVLVWTNVIPMSLWGLE